MAVILDRKTIGDAEILFIDTDPTTGLMVSGPVLAITQDTKKLYLFNGPLATNWQRLPELSELTSGLAAANSYTDSKIADLINAAPGVLDTLQELAQALGNDPNFATTIATSISNVQSNLNDHEADLNNPHATTKTQVGLGNVDNTSDINKPVSTAQQTALDLKYDASNPNGYETPAELNTRDANNRNRSNHTGTQTASTISDFNSAASAAAPVQSVAGKTGAVSLVKADVGLGNVDNTSDLNKPVSTAQATAINTAQSNAEAFSIQRSNHTGTQLASTISDFNSAASTAAPVQSVAGKTGAVSLVKADVGLGNVDNTSDLNKPVSTAQATAINTAQSNAENYADGLIQSLIGTAPGTLDTLQELADALGNDPNFASTLSTALANRLRVDVNNQGLSALEKNNAKTNIDLQNVDNTSDSNKPVSTAQAAADTAVQNFSIQRSNHTGTQLAATISDFNSAASSAAPVQSVAGKTGAVSLVKADVGLGNVDNTSDLNKPVSTAQAAADTAIQNFSIQRSNHTGTQLAATISNFAATVLSTVLTGYTVGTNTALAATDSILLAFRNIQGQINAIFNRNINTGTGLIGGGNLTSDRTLALADTAVTSGTYGNATQYPAFVVDPQGRLTSATNVDLPVFGQNYQSFSDLTVFTSTSGANQVAATFTTSNIPGASYILKMSWLWRYAATTSDAIFGIYFDGVLLGQEFRMELSETTTQNIPFAFDFEVTTPSASTHTIQLRSRSEAAGVTLTVNQVYAQLWRVS